MAQSDESIVRFWGRFHGPNMGYIEEQYELYLEDPEVVDPSIKKLFEEHGAPEWIYPSDDTIQRSTSKDTIGDVRKLTAAMKLVDAIRRYGNLEADIYPVGHGKKRQSNLVDPKSYALTDQDLRNIPADWLWENAPSHVRNGLDVVNELKKLYSGTITYEYDHVNSDEERQWLLEQIEHVHNPFEVSKEDKVQLLERLSEVEGFESFLQKTFVGQKRFSIEGLEAMVPMLDNIVKYANQDKIENIMVGMAHRGRLSVLAHVLGKPLDAIFSEFVHSPNKELVPSEGSRGINYGWSGDVKYHFGAVKDVDGEDQTRTRITMAHNPSHLEFVNPIVNGFARAAQEDRSERGSTKQDMNKAIPVLIHGDAAFIGEGIVAETLNLSNLSHYSTGGSIHIIANNLVGYTTNQQDGRSTRYASDLAKGFEIPIVHVNADDPIACVEAVRLAYDYRQKFNKDFLIDLVGYRRYGHNEMDEPRATQPTLYKSIDNHPTAASVFADKLANEGIIQQEQFAEMKEIIETNLRQVYDNMKEDDIKPVEPEMPAVLQSELEEVDTAISKETIHALNKGLLERPEGFQQFKGLNRILKRRKKAFDEGNKADWGTAEALTYASILKDGIPIRIMGQDTERGTFAHRHLILHDAETGETYCPMHGLDEAKASFYIGNSPLSEAGVLGFEYGYSIQSPETLVIWEAQFGDFANVAQVIFDQFMSSARAKWNDISNMVLLLPHGYEGQGPEHSSARLERFLQLSAENNWFVCNVTSTAQFFHLMRRQAVLKGSEQARPLILMTPKSLLRNQRIASPAEEFASGHFEVIRNQPNLKVSKKNAKRLLIGSGKVMVDIEQELEKSEKKLDFLRALRLEQIYPFPKKELEKELKQLPNLEEIVWVQEEPRNMGSWNFVSEHLRDLLQDNQSLRYVGRPDRSSPAVGDPDVHKMEQKQIVLQAINPTIGGESK